jgi:transcription-repair coupling factor (superfamily II helicase)
MEGKQAAILAPTTILTRQHYNTVMSRTQGYGLRVGVLSRFESDKKIKETLKQLSDGEIDIIVGTHRMLSKDVSFHDLGLLVLDEEQRFGVEHKERIKLLKNNINVLSLSATPIPRTLHMSLSGIRDISLLETPPANRIPVQTYVTEYTDGLLIDAISREVGRGGQVFVLYNYVETIDSFAAKIKDLTDARVTVAHGQMSAEMLDERVTSFYEGEADVLVCTTIIENGIDLPSANTLIVYDSDRFGLAQLYQLRGRVGRSGSVAHAYFTYKQGKVLTENAMQRLNAIMDYTDFGSGYKIALRDLQIRGAGNILGREQHGHMEKVGYDLYCKLLKEAVDEARGIEKETEKEVDVKIDTDIYIDERYIGGSDKMRVYNLISRISSNREKNRIIDEITAAYGKPPEAMLNLIDIALLKNLGKKLNVEKIVINDAGAGVIFDSAVLYDRRITDLLGTEKDVILTGADKPTLLFNVKLLNNRAKMHRVLAFLVKAIS